VTAILDIEELSAGYGHVSVLHGLSFSVSSGTITSLLGANGAGKTTTLRAISHLIKPAGVIRFDGDRIDGLRPDRIARLGISHVPQGRGTLHDLTVEDNLKAGLVALGRRAPRGTIESWFERFPQLGNSRGRRAATLSGGEQQMLALARGLIGRPRLLLLDEPSLGLAPIVTREVFAHLSQLRAELDISVLLVEQNANLALEYSDAAYVLESGRIVRSGAANLIAQDESVRLAYLGY
jgi:branched-chain amino acid transport system ATP-binding protein